jgi:hypothetical protein
MSISKQIETIQSRLQSAVAISERLISEVGRSSLAETLCTAEAAWAAGLERSRSATPSELLATVTAGRKYARCARELEFRTAAILREFELATAPLRKELESLRARPNFDQDC